MPYALRKKPGQDKYWVINKDTKKKYSNDALDKNVAMKQLKALYVAEGTPFSEYLGKKMPSRTRYVKGSDNAMEVMAKVREARIKKREERKNAAAAASTE